MVVTRRRRSERPLGSLSFTGHRPPCTTFPAIDELQFNDIEKPTIPRLVDHRRQQTDKTRSSPSMLTLMFIKDSTLLNFKGLSHKRAGQTSHMKSRDVPKGSEFVVIVWLQVRMGTGAE